MATCEFWDDDAPCGRKAVECLVYCNPRIDGGHTWTCAGHLAEHAAHHMLEARLTMVTETRYRTIVAQ